MLPARISIVTYNIWLTQRWAVRAPAVRGFLESFSPDILCLQELQAQSREFYVLDRDRSGYLTPDEVKGDAVLEQNFKKIDKNRDGKVSLDEFTDFP